MAKCGGLRAGPDVASVGGMWRLAIAVVCVLGGCGQQVEIAPDAAGNSSVLAGQVCAAELQLCAHTEGLCFEQRCRTWCGLVTGQATARCAAMSHEQHMPFDTNPDACICVPD